jgi:hypothetical protein
MLLKQQRATASARLALPNVIAELLIVCSRLHRPDGARQEAADEHIKREGPMCQRVVTRLSKLSEA